jgi:hypothetical protein
VGWGLNLTILGVDFASPRPPTNAHFGAKSWLKMHAKKTKNRVQKTDAKLIQNKQKK